MRLIILFFLFFYSCSVNKKVIDDASDIFYIEIRQIVYGKSDQYSFIISDKTLFILRESFSKEGFSERNRIYSKTIKDYSKMKDIKSKVEDLKELESEYIIAQLGGIRWEIDYVQGNFNKKIIIANTTVNEVSLLFKEINSIIPESKPHISLY